MSFPHTIFIVPYRNRPNEKKSLDDYFLRLKNDRKWSDNHVKFLYIHQVDTKLFNRGAMKNIGFIYVKKTYPDDYKNITFVFHDVDFYPDSTSLLSYEAKKGEVQHYYGFKYVLGGIFSIKGSDFEKIGGFPNYWGWGFEDNKIHDRCIKNKIVINRDNFYNIYDKHFIYCDKGDKNDYFKTVSDEELNIYRSKIYGETFNSIKNLKLDTKDNIINVINFETGRMYSQSEFSVRDLAKTGAKVKPRKGWFRKNWNMSQIGNNSMKKNHEMKTIPTNNVKPVQQPLIRRNWKLF